MRGHNYLARPEKIAPTADGAEFPAESQQGLHTAMMTSMSPRPGQSVRGSSTGRPIMALFDLVGRRWNLRVIWELHRAEKPPTFRTLRERCDGVSSSVLTHRLDELTQARLVTHNGSGYTLTPTGQQLVTAIGPLLDWSRDWAVELDHS
jgi:DNA-binding HxlR family transcriptional regulator